MYEMWKRKQINQDARKTLRTKIIVKRFGTMEETTFWEVMTWSEEWMGEGEVLI